uniref:RING-type E3 ubiquitin transferase n=1 Tax=Bicosoecida sp. CB-2014 TaxID=1486930 RepID=A0A7S1CLB4_9STRA|mmetsp:Transcript_3600/g.13121  ORF Transcript_3600/g.13121 Transcript_3600/m.13121 type:complete len:1495 (+) Transcript_3600:61-4545(+)
MDGGGGGGGAAAGGAGGSPARATMLRRRGRDAATDEAADAAAAASLSVSPAAVLLQSARVAPRVSSERAARLAAAAAGMGDGGAGGAGARRGVDPAAGAASASEAVTPEEPEVAECRVCRGTEPPLFEPCRCSGSVAAVHQECLTEWLRVSGKQQCELCGERFKWRRTFARNAPRRLRATELLNGAVTTAWRAAPAQCATLLSFVLWGLLLPLATGLLSRLLLCRDAEEVDATLATYHPLAWLPERMPHALPATDVGGSGGAVAADGGGGGEGGGAAPVADAVTTGVWLMVPALVRLVPRVGAALFDWYHHTVLHGFLCWAGLWGAALAMWESAKAAASMVVEVQQEAGVAVGRLHGRRRRGGDGGDGDMPLPPPPPPRRRAPVIDNDNGDGDGDGDGGVGGGGDGAGDGVLADDFLVGGAPADDGQPPGRRALNTLRSTGRVLLVNVVLLCVLQVPTHAVGRRGLALLRLTHDFNNAHTAQLGLPPLPLPHELGAVGDVVVDGATSTAASRSTAPVDAAGGDSGGGAEAARGHAGAQESPPPKPPSSTAKYGDHVWRRADIRDVLAVAIGAEDDPAVAALRRMPAAEKDAMAAASDKDGSMSRVTSLAQLEALTVQWMWQLLIDGVKSRAAAGVAAFASSTSADTAAQVAPTIDAGTSAAGDAVDAHAHVRVPMFEATAAPDGSLRAPGASVEATEAAAARDKTGGSDSGSRANDGSSSSTTITAATTTTTSKVELVVSDTIVAATTLALGAALLACATVSVVVSLLTAALIVAVVSAAATEMRNGTPLRDVTATATAATPAVAPVRVRVGNAAEGAADAEGAAPAAAATAATAPARAAAAAGVVLAAPMGEGAARAVAHELSAPDRAAVPEAGAAAAPPRRDDGVVPAAAATVAPERAAVVAPLRRFVLSTWSLMASAAHTAAWALLCVGLWVGDIVVLPHLLGWVVDMSTAPLMGWDLSGRLSQAAAHPVLSPLAHWAIGVFFTWLAVAVAFPALRRFVPPRLLPAEMVNQDAAFAAHDAPWPARDNAAADSMQIARESASLFAATALLAGVCVAAPAYITAAIAPSLLPVRMRMPWTHGIIVHMLAKSLAFTFPRSTLLRAVRATWMALAEAAGLEEGVLLHGDLLTLRRRRQAPRGEAGGADDGDDGGAPAHDGRDDAVAAPNPLSLTARMGAVAKRTASVQVRAALLGATATTLVAVCVATLCVIAPLRVGRSALATASDVSGITGLVTGGGGDLGALLVGLHAVNAGVYVACNAVAAAAATPQARLLRLFAARAAHWAAHAVLLCVWAVVAPSLFGLALWLCVRMPHMVAVDSRPLLVFAVDMHDWVGGLLVGHLALQLATTDVVGDMVGDTALRRALRRLRREGVAAMPPRWLVAHIMVPVLLPLARAVLLPLFVVRVASPLLGASAATQGVLLRFAFAWYVLAAAVAAAVEAAGAAAALSSVSSMWSVGTSGMPPSTYPVPTSSAASGSLSAIIRSRMVVRGDGG